MGTGIVTYGTDPKAKTITVYYTESSTIYEGMPVCYEFDATTNWLGVSSIDATSTASSITESSTTSEGSQNEGKFIRVEDPDADNIHAFAGVVAGAGLAGKTGPCAIDIYIPNGAIVPVRTDQNCTVGRTILAVHTAEQHLTGPYETAGRSIAVAWETVDRSSTTGVCLAKLDPNMFLYQKGDALGLLIDDQDSGNTLVANQVNVSSGQTSGRFTAFSVIGAATGACNATGYGIALYAEADISAAMSGETAGSSFWMNLTGGTQTNELYAVEVGLYESGANLASCNRISPIVIRSQLDSTNPPASSHYMITFICDGTGDHPDALFACNEAADIALAAQSAAAVSHVIPIHVGTPGSTTTYYLMVSNAA